MGGKYWDLVLLEDISYTKLYLIYIIYIILYKDCSKVF
jgi:hypothetical protein